jgi:hypothetical protein
VREIILVLALIVVLVLILPGCDGTTELPYRGPIDDGGDQPSDGDVTPTPPDNGTPQPPAPPIDDDTDGLQPPSPPIF